MITLIVFSKDRAAQLDLLLTSIQQNARHLFVDNKVLYTYSNNNYKQGYKKVINKWSDVFDFVLQEDFCSDVKKITNNKNKLLCFLTDDDIVYKKIPIKLSSIYSLFEDMEIGCLSLRTGKNTTNIYNFTNTKEEIKYKLEHPKYIADYEDVFCIWNRLSTPHINYNYILSLNGHIFRAKTFNYLINAFKFDNPNHLEGQLQKYQIFLSPLMASLPQSHIVNVPINKVQQTNNNVFGLQYSFSQEDMNKLYLEEKQIDFDNIDFSSVTSTHQEFDLEFT